MLLALGTMMLHPAATAMMANMTMVNPRRMNIMFAKDPSDGTNQITASPMASPTAVTSSGWDRANVRIVDMRFLFHWQGRNNDACETVTG